MKASRAALGAARFIAIFLVVSGAASLVLAPVGQLNQLALESTRAFLGAAGIPAYAIGYSGSTPLLAVTGFPLQVAINDLCSAKIELAILLGIIAATEDRSVRHRILGFATGALAALLVNPVRIGLSVIYFDPLVHDVLFRVMLVAVILGYYAVWYLFISDPDRANGKVRKSARK